MAPDILEGLAQASQLVTILAVAGGCFIGLVIGMIPGLTISTGIIIVLPLTFGTRYFNSAFTRSIC